MLIDLAENRAQGRVFLQHGTTDTLLVRDNLVGKAGPLFRSPATGFTQRIGLTLEVFSFGLKLGMVRQHLGTGNDEFLLVHGGEK